MKIIIWIAGAVLLTATYVQGQTQLNGGSTRQQTIQKGRLLRKTTTPTTAYHVNGGTRINKVPKHALTDGAPRTQPIITKPLPPVQTQP